MRIKDLTVTALLTAVLCAVSPFTIPIGPIPLSLATFGVYLAAGIGGKRRGIASVFIYILLGAAGLPVFSGFTGGFHKLAGVTGGFFAGYVICAVVIALITSDPQSGAWRHAVGMIAGTFLLYAVGTAWFVLSTKTGLPYSLTICVLPFIPGDALKIAVASAICPRIRRALERGAR